MGRSLQVCYPGRGLKTTNVHSVSFPLCTDFLFGWLALHRRKFRSGIVWAWASSTLPRHCPLYPGNDLRFPTKIVHKWNTIVINVVEKRWQCKRLRLQPFPYPLSPPSGPNSEITYFEMIPTWKENTLFVKVVVEHRNASHRCDVNQWLFCQWVLWLFHTWEHRIVTAFFPPHSLLMSVYI